MSKFCWYDLAYLFSNQTRFLGFELHMMEQFGSRRPIRYWCYWLPEVIVAFQSEDILSYPSSVLTLIIRMHPLIDISNTWCHGSYCSGFLQIISWSKRNVQLRVICITMGTRKMWFDDLKKFASIERENNNDPRQLPCGTLNLRLKLFDRTPSM